MKKLIMKNNKIVEKEKQLTNMALKLAVTYLDDSKPLLDMAVVGKKYAKLEKQWLDLLYKIIVGNNKTIITKKIHNRRIKEIEYFVWFEDFIDEANGNVVSVERTKIVKINGNLVDCIGKPIKFDLLGKKLIHKY